MAIQVVQRKQEPRERPEEKTDPLDLIMKGLAAAQSISSIKGNMDAQEHREFQQNRMTEQDAITAAEAERVASGNLNPREVAGLREKGFVPTTADDPLGVGFNTGRGDEQTPLSLKPGMTAAQQGVYAQNAAKIEALATKAAQKLTKDDFKNKNDREKGLREEYRKASDDTFKISNAFSRVKSLAREKNPTGADDIAMINGVMRIFDPGVSVREGDVTLLRSASSVPEWLIGQYENALAGNKLVDTQRQNLFRAAATTYKGQIEMQADTDSRFSKLAERLDADVEDVIDMRYGSELQNFGELDDIIAGMATGSQDGGVNEQRQRETVLQKLLEEKKRRSNVGGGR